jgi:hypothetical protein
MFRDKRPRRRTIVQVGSVPDGQPRALIKLSLYYLTPISRRL